VALLLALPLMGDPLTSLSKRLGATFSGGNGGVDTQALMAGSGLALRSSGTQPERDLPGSYRITPERRALLNTIRYAEGTWVGGSNEGYRILYGGGRFESLERHPEIVVRKRYVSAAAGAYQFLPATWREAAKRLGLADFTAPSQDQAALYLVEKRGALASFDRHGLTAEVLNRLAHEWASLPNLAGASAYGQPVKALEELQRFYGLELARQRAASADLDPLV
jgi:lysozyme